MERMEKPMRKQGVLDGPRADGPVWLHPAVLRAANPLVPYWTTHDRPRAWTARPSVSDPGVRATAERERSGSGAGGAERERSESGARLRVGKNRSNSVRYT